MNIQDAVEVVRIDFMRSTGLSPTKLYLGWKQDRELVTAMDSMAFFHSPSSDFQHRRNYRGLDLYKVDAPDYIAVGT